MNESTWHLVHLLTTTTACAPLLVQINIYFHQDPVGFRMPSGCQGLEHVLGRELRKLIEHYERIALSESEALQRFRESGVKCAGSFPLYYCVQPRPLHRRTKEELYAMIAVANRVAVTLPRTFLERLADLLQFSGLAEDFSGNEWDINLFGDLHRFRRLFQHLQTPDGLPRPWIEGDMQSEYQRNYNLLFPDTFSTARFGYRRRVQLIFLNKMPWHCDLPFCKNMYDGRLHATATRMEGPMHLDQYKRVLDTLFKKREEIASLNALLGLQTEHTYESLLSKLASTVEERLAKYERRRFSITNAQEALGFARRVRLHWGISLYSGIKFT